MTRAKVGDGYLLEGRIIGEFRSRLRGEQLTRKDLSIRSIGDSLGVTPPALYLHFDSWARIVDAVACEVSVEAMQGYSISEALTPTRNIPGEGRTDVLESLVLLPLRVDGPDNDFTVNTVQARERLRLNALLATVEYPTYGLATVLATRVSEQLPRVTREHGYETVCRVIGEGMLELADLAKLPPRLKDWAGE